MKNLYILFITLLFFGCKVFHCPKVTTSSTIQGLTIKGSNYQNFESFIIMHGIGSKESNYSEKIINRLNTFKFGKNNFQCNYSVYINGGFKQIHNQSLKKIYETYNNRGGVEALKIVVTDSLRPEIKANQYYSINWAVAVQNSKDSLVNAEMNNSPFYLGINKMLKKMVMMRRVSDAFSGSKPQIIIKLHKLLCQIITDGNLFNKNSLNVITGSFGTQITLGLLQEIQQFENSKLFKNKFEFQEIFSQLAKADNKGIDYYKAKLTIDTTQKLKIFSLSNQLNLMPNNINGWYSNLKRDSSHLNFDSVQIVAFRNPNDILCYYMPQKTAEQFFPKTTNVKVINTYYFNWPIRNDVATAHTVVFDSKKLAKIIHYGTYSNWARVKENKFQ